MKSSVVRTLVFCVFVALVLLGLIFNEGFGTLCSFGYKAIAAVCPLGALEQMVASRVFVPGVLIGAAIFFLLVVLFGRFFCGWLCPVPNLRRLFSKNKNPEIPEKPIKLSGKFENPSRCRSCSQSCASFSVCGKTESTIGKTDIKLNAAQDKGRKLARNMPYAVLGGTVASTAIFGFPVFCLICPVGLFFALIIGFWQLFVFSELSWSLPAAIGVLGLEVFVLRRWCHKFCPLGALISLMSVGNRFFRPKIDKSACLKSAHGINCTKCRAVCPVDIDLHSIDSAADFSKCMKCRQCAEVCPENAISFPFWNVRRRKTSESSSVKSDTAVVDVQKNESVQVTAQSVRELASRCVACGHCVEACPVHNPIPQWLSLSAQGKFVQAGRLLFSPGAMPEICSRICPQEKLCESACPLTELNRPIPIGALSTFISDNYLKKGRYTSTRHKKVLGKVAVIGAGPCGLACADALNSESIDVVVFDRHEDVGGMLQYAIPDFKLDKHLLEVRRKLLEKAGIAFRFNCEVGRNLNFKAIVEEFDAVFVSTGASEPLMPELPGSDNPLIGDAITYLEKSCLIPQQAQSQVQGLNIAVLGAGDTAMDTMRTALRHKAASATCICRKPLREIRAARKEVQAALQEGGRFVDDVDVIGFESGANGGVSVFVKERTAGEVRKLAFDVVFVAYGLKPVAAQWLKDEGIEQLPDGRVCVDANYQTGNPRVFAGGDVVRGASLAVKCVLDGRQAADNICTYLKEKKGRRA